VNLCNSSPWRWIMFILTGNAQSFLWLQAGLHIIWHLLRSLSFRSREQCSLRRKAKKCFFIILRAVCWRSQDFLSQVIIAALSSPQAFSSSSSINKSKPAVFLFPPFFLPSSSFSPFSSEISVVPYFALHLFQSKWVFEYQHWLMKLNLEFSNSWNLKWNLLSKIFHLI